MDNGELLRCIDRKVTETRETVAGVSREVGAVHGRLARVEESIKGVAHSVDTLRDDGCSKLPDVREQLGRLNGRGGGQQKAIDNLAGRDDRQDDATASRRRETLMLLGVIIAALGGLGGIGGLVVSILK